MSITRRHVAATAAAALLVPTLSGCWSGFGAQTSQQANQAVGNGTNLATGDVEVRGATWVRNAAKPEEATLVATFLNGAEVPDRLVKVEVQPAAPTGITAGALDVPIAGSVRTGYWSPNFVNVFGLQALPSAFVTTTLTFENAGSVTGDIMTVPNVGQYQGVVVSLAEQRKLQKFVDAATEESAEDATPTEKVAKAKAKKKAQAEGE